MGRKDSKNSSGRSQKSSSSSSSRRSTRKAGGDQVENSGIGDLTVVNEEKGLFGMSDLMKASAEMLGNGGMGSAYKADFGNGLVLAVKRMRELNKLQKDEFDGEIRKLASFKHDNILPLLAYHHRKVEKLVVYQHVTKGSLNYLLHGDRGRGHEQLNWPRRLETIKGITRGLCYLHNELDTYELPHGNLKSSNILINSRYQPLLSDYGFNIMADPDAAAHSSFGYRSAIHQKLISPKCDVFC